MATRKKNLSIALCALLAAAVLLSGCVERKLTINTEPQGAVIVLNDEEIGVSPVTVGFNWYGDYKVRISKEGFETLNTHRELKGPAHDGFPLDFFAEVLWPERIVDEYQWDFELCPYVQIDRDELIKAAEAVKSRAVVISAESKQ